jgi:hypothetical protein
MSLIYFYHLIEDGVVRRVGLTIDPKTRASTHSRAFPRHNFVIVGSTDDLQYARDWEIVEIAIHDTYQNGWNKSRGGDYLCWGSINRKGTGIKAAATCKSRNINTGQISADTRRRNGTLQLAGQNAAKTRAIKNINTGQMAADARRLNGTQLSTNEKAKQTRIANDSYKTGAKKGWETRRAKNKISYELAHHIL